MDAVETSELAKARALLLSGEVVAVPTETVYGLAASIKSPKALRKIFELKGRPLFDPLIVHVASIKQAQSLVSEWPPLADFLARTFWPGAFTLVLKKSDSVNSLITAGLDTVAVRYPSHPLMNELIRLVGSPLAAPSANRFGKTSPSTASHVRSEFPESGLYVIDGGACEVGLESTVVMLEGEDNEEPDVIKILRPGGITEEQLEKALKHWMRPVRIETLTTNASGPLTSPGTMKSHYMPEIPLVIVAASEPENLSQETKSKISEHLGRTPQNAVELKLSPDPVVSAHVLYAELRRLSHSGADLIYVRRPGTEFLGALPSEGDHGPGLWTAVWDRLSRAASLDVL